MFLFLVLLLHFSPIKKNKKVNILNVNEILEGDWKQAVPVSVIESSPAILTEQKFLQAESYFTFHVQISIT